ncbi:tyrosine-type recombinase/integrase [Shimia thalassica]|uniref:tyrosine-type recombinase/integrase n=1 Tax=Shimia thalassica TaxID=1715693 RepID=UPI0027351867|nr:integrase arm-type DNA-binding domain-containing protein [Shimia thalassica]MDP2518733.1 integrase arm-type DNA-binding domain-containing protein [Shimia thalassica]
MALTESKIRTAKPRDKRYRMSDGGGLVMDITPAGKKVWRYRLQNDGKDSVVTLGTYPELGLLDARQAALDIRKEGVAPAVAKARVVAAQGITFQSVADLFMARERPHWAVGHYERFHNRMTHDVYPMLGDLHPRDIKPADVVAVADRIVARGAVDTSVRVVGMVGQVMRYAVAKGLADRDVTADLKGGLDRPAPVQHMPAVLDRTELGRMLTDIWDWAGDSYGKPLLQLSAYLFQRPGEIQAMRWADIDLDRGLWTYRVSKVGIDHAVPLASQVVEILRGLHRQTGEFEYVFYSHTAKCGHVSPQIAVKLLDKIGWRDRQTPHGFRAVARTIIAEDLRIEPRLIEQQLSHGVAETHGRAYNRTVFLDERTEMMQAYADHLDRLRG